VDPLSGNILKRLRIELSQRARAVKT
jgi:hypothetical protein